MPIKNLLRKLLKSNRSGSIDMFDPGDHDGLFDEDLQAAIEAVTEDASEENRRHLFEVLLKATFCLSISEEDGSSSVTAIKNEHGDIALVAFTDPPCLKRWTGEATNMMVLPGQKLFAFVLENNFAEVQINPAGPIGGRIPRFECELLAEGKIPL